MAGALAVRDYPVIAALPAVLAREAHVVGRRPAVEGELAKRAQEGVRLALFGREAERLGYGSLPRDERRLRRRHRRPHARVLRAAGLPARAGTSAGPARRSASCRRLRAGGRRRRGPSIEGSVWRIEGMQCASR